MTPRLSPAIAGQLLWLAAATGFNLMSWYRLTTGHPAWAGATPLQAEGVVLLFALATLAALLRAHRLAMITGALVVVLLFAGGVVRHFFAPPDAYASGLTWGAAIGINLFGVAAFALGVASSSRALRSSCAE